jgi:hypothetical protein
MRRELCLTPSRYRALYIFSRHLFEARHCTWDRALFSRACSGLHVLLLRTALNGSSHMTQRLSFPFLGTVRAKARGQLAMRPLSEAGSIPMDLAHPVSVSDLPLNSMSLTFEKVGSPYLALRQ